MGREKAATGQLSNDAAVAYEERFVPALFAEWAPRVLDAARVGADDEVLDVACGTGIVARTAVDRVAPGGTVTGLDLNAGMLAVAERLAPSVTWREGRAEALPFADASFDAVTCQFGLMFFTDPVQALREMHRVARPGGRIAVAVWDALERSPGEAALTRSLEKHVGKDAAAALRVPYALGDVATLRAEFREAGLPDVDVRTMPGTARYDSVAAFVQVEVDAWTLRDDVDEDALATLVNEAERALQEYVRPDGRLEMPAPAHIAVVTRA